MGDLIARLEAASGPDRELDGWIEVERDPTRQTIVDQEPGRFPQKPIYGSIGIIMETIGGKDGADYINAPVYTASIDAAMALVPANTWLSMSGPMSPEAYGYSREDERQPRAGLTMIGPPYCGAGRAATFPLALCIAALRARQAAK